MAHGEALTDEVSSVVCDSYSALLMEFWRNGGEINVFITDHSTVTVDSIILSYIQYFMLTSKVKRPMNNSVTCENICFIFNGLSSRLLVPVFGIF